MLSREYLSFTRRERIGIITLVIILIIAAVMPRFFCRPKPIAEKLPDEKLQLLVERKTNYFTEKRNRDRDTVFVRKYVPSQFRNYYSEPKYQGRFKKRDRGTANRLRGRGERGDTLIPRNRYAPRPGWLRPPTSPININTADTSAFIALPGIGSKLANRIVSFRTKLGGFNSVEQIKEVYGLKDSVFQLIQPLLYCQFSP